MCCRIPKGQKYWLASEVYYQLEKIIEDSFAD